MDVWPHDYLPDGVTPQEVREDQFRHTLAAATQTGVDRTSGAGDTDALKAAAVSDSSGVTIQPGYASLNGYSVENPAETTVSAPANGASLPRMYRVVIRHDVSGRAATGEILEGTAASSPQLPALTRTSTLWEEPLAQFRREAGGGISAFEDARVFLNPHGPVLCRRHFRPPTPTEGMQTYELDTGRLLQRIGGSWTIIAETEYPTPWEPLTLGSNYHNANGGFRPEGRMLTPTQVALRGTIAADDGTIGSNSIIARVPESMWPREYVRLICATESTSTAQYMRLDIVHVDTSGFLPGQIRALPQGGHSPEWMSLDGIVYETN